MEYGIAYCQYSYSLPKVITELFHVYMRVNYPDYFSALGFSIILYDAAANKFDKAEITDRIKEIQYNWKDKYPLLDFKTANLRFENLVNYNHSFLMEMENLNMEAK